VDNIKRGKRETGVYECGWINVAQVRHRP